ncbi:MAG: hypothetical protein Fur0044_08860 [Anaerolineae bacterium]
MNRTAADFIRTWRIDSYQKLRALLFLYQHPELPRTCQQLAEKLSLGYLPLVDEIINYLQQVGLVKCERSSCKLNDDPEVRTNLSFLTQAYEDPLARQEVLDLVKTAQYIQPNQVTFVTKLNDIHHCYVFCYRYKLYSE